jgi:hypothetical protein
VVRFDVRRTADLARPFRDAPAFYLVLYFPSSLNLEQVIGIRAVPLELVPSNPQVVLSMFRPPFIYVPFGLFRSSHGGESYHA